MGTKYTYSEGATYQSESTPITVSKIPTGKYKIKAVSGYAEGEYSYIAGPGTQEITVTVAEPVYSIIYDKSLASDPAGCLTYAGLCEGFTPMSGGSGNADEGSWAEGNETIFDAIKVGYIDNGNTFVEMNKSAVAGNTAYNCFTRIPKIYQRVTDISDAGDNSKVKLDLSLKPFSGATLHPAFIMDGVEFSYKDIGRYLGTVSSSKLTSKSVSNGYPQVSKTMEEFRTYATANGSNYGLLSYYDWDLVNKFILLGFKSFDTKNVIGYGQSTGSTTGTSTANISKTNGKSWMYGMTGDHNYLSVLGIEDWWGNCSQLIDNLRTGSSGGKYYLYVSSSSSPSDSTSDKSILCERFKGDSTYPLTCRAGLNDFFIGESGGGSYNTGMCTTQSYGSYGPIHVGGTRYQSLRGAFHVGYTNDIVADKLRSTRLVHWE